MAVLDIVHIPLAQAGAFHFPQSLGLDLAHSLTGDPHQVANLGQRLCGLTIHAQPVVEDKLLLGRQDFPHNLMDGIA
mgnify:CR=1 FL=1